MCTNLGDFSKFFQAAREGHGKTEKQQHSPEATVALELGGNLQYGSKIRFKLKKKKKKGKPSGTEGPGDSEAQSRAGRQMPSSLMLQQGCTQNIYFLACCLYKPQETLGKKGSSPNSEHPVEAR